MTQWLFRVPCSPKASPKMKKETRTVAVWIQIQLHSYASVHHTVTQEDQAVLPTLTLAIHPSTHPLINPSTLQSLSARLRRQPGTGRRQQAGTGMARMCNRSGSQG